MPTPGLSLVGFMDEPQALEHLKKACVPPAGSTDDTLRAEWAAARAKLGAPIANPGNPNLQPVPASYTTYVATLLTLPWVASAIAAGTAAANVQMVEIEPLLAYQFSIDNTRSNHHCSNLATPPALDELFATCLPTAQPIEMFTWFRDSRSVLIKAKSLNFRVQREGIMDNIAGGILFGPSLPLTQVVRLNGRCYLHNGFHRAVGLAQRGATHMPCVFRDVPDAEAAGIRADNNTFSEALLMSANPPTLGHFCQGRAYDVQIRATSRVMHVSWADYVVADE